MDARPTGEEQLSGHDERLLRAIIESAVDYAIITTDPQGVITSWNAGAEAILGWRADEAIGLPASLIFTPEDRQSGAPDAEMAKALAAGTARDERWHLRKDGVRFWGRGELMVLRNDAVDGFLKVLRDRTEERIANQRLEDSEKRLSLALESARMAVWEFDAASNRVNVTKDLKVLLGFAPDADVSLEDIRSRYAPGERERIALVGQRAIAAGHRYAESELRCEWDGETRWFLIRGEFIWRSSKDAPDVVGIIFDITDQKRAEERLHLLVNELNHRVKNNLAVVQAMAGQTLRGDLTDALQKFNDRLSSLARAHDLLIRHHWEGARLEEILSDTAAAHTGVESGRFHVSGCNEELPPEVAVSLAMVFHELATNAVKYGSLSQDSGTVSVSCSRRQEGTERILTITWQEQGGPAAAPPANTGFGSRLIERAIRGDGRGDVALDFEETGLRCTMTVVLDG